MEAHLRAGIAIHNAGGYRAAHDAWEDYWLSLASGTDDEQFLHGLIQVTVAVYHGRNGNWSGATRLAESAGDYLADLPADYRGVNLDEVRSYLAALAADPELIERGRPLWLTHEGDRLAFADLDFEATAVVATVLAEELDYDEATVERAAEFGRADLAAGETGGPFVPLVFDFVREPDDREIVYQRLSEHVRRRKSREEDVEGLFE